MQEYASDGCSTGLEEGSAVTVCRQHCSTDGCNIAPGLRGGGWVAGWLWDALYGGQMFNNMRTKGWAGWLWGISYGAQKFNQNMEHIRVQRSILFETDRLIHKNHD